MLQKKLTIMINNTAFSRFRVAEFTQLLANTLKIIESNDPNALKITAQTAALITAAANLDEEYKKQKSSSITAKLVELDERRDNAVTGILRVVSGFELHYESLKRDAARRIGLVVNKYGTGMARLRYQQETGEIRSMLGDLKDPAVAIAVSELGLDAWLEELKEANQEFDAAYVQRSQEMAGDSSQVIALRATAQEKWDALTAHLTAHATLTPSPSYTKTLAELNSLIDDYKNAAISRSGDETLPSPTPPPIA